MKVKFISLFILVPLILVYYVASAQNQSVLDYIGTWQWVSGNNDTFRIVLQPKEKKFGSQTSLQNSTNLIGYHLYIERGQMIESNIKAAGGNDTTTLSIVGVFQENKLSIAWFRDFTRNSSFRGSFQILKDFPKKALWNTPYMNEKYIFQDMDIREYPLGRTVPNNIVLEKIN